MRKKAGFKILIVIILFAILVISNISYRNYKLSLQNDLGKTKKRIEQNIFRKEKIARENLESLKNYSEQYPGQNIFGLDRISKLSEKEKISFQVYNNDSLLYWSDNKLSDHENNIILFSDSNFIKINNGWYDMIRIKEGHKKYIAAILIKPEYGFENDYLVNEFSPDFRISSRNVTISSSGKTNMVKNSEGNDLFSITVKNTSVLETVDESITIILFLLEFLALLYLIHHGIRKLFPKEKRSGLNISLFVVSIIALRLLTFYFKIPKSLYDTRFFSPLYFASSEFLPSLGDLLWNSLVVLIIGVFLFQNLRFKNDRRPQKGILRISLSFIFNLLLALLFLLFMKTIRSLVVDSTISFNLNQIFSINGLSLIGLFIIFLACNYYPKHSFNRLSNIL